jgi:tyrosine-specific transport protein
MNRFIGSIALIAGTSIGAGMLALPLATVKMGFWPSVLAFFLLCAVMVYVGLLILEVLVKMPRHTTLISMAECTLGKTGRFFAIVSYFFLLFMLNTAYLGGASGLIMDGLSLDSTSVFLKFGICFGLICMLGAFVCLKTEVLDQFNRVLVIGMVVAYLFMMICIIPNIECARLTQVSWACFPFALPLISTSFGYHIILPNIFEYLSRDVKHTRLAIMIGSFFPLVVYLVWQLMVLGSVPMEGENSLIEALHEGASATVPLVKALDSGKLALAVLLFSLFAILT